MTDTLASLKRELKILGPVDYSTNTRQQREMILGQIAELEAELADPGQGARRIANKIEWDAASKVRSDKLAAEIAPHLDAAWERKIEAQRAKDAHVQAMRAERRAAKLAAKAL